MAFVGSGDIAGVLSNCGRHSRGGARDGMVRRCGLALSGSDMRVLGCFLCGVCYCGERTVVMAAYYGTSHRHNDGRDPVCMVSETGRVRGAMGD